MRKRDEMKKEKEEELWKVESRGEKRRVKGENEIGERSGKKESEEMRMRKCVKKEGGC